MKEKLLAEFMSREQFRCLQENRRAEEGVHFDVIAADLAERLEKMPKTYEQDGKGDQAIAYLHYFTASCDWYITERDTNKEQHQAFGLSRMGFDELGYISIVELLRAGAELDLYFAPTPLEKIKKPTARKELA